jgi:hypothetical protein
VCLGIRDAYLAIRTDDQLENRFHPLVLPLWEAGKSWRGCWPASKPSSPCVRRPICRRLKPLNISCGVQKARLGEMATLLAAQLTSPCGMGMRKSARPRSHRRSTCHPACVGAPLSGRCARGTPLMPKRWPLHPHRTSWETLESYVRRLAGCYGFRYETFCLHALGIR